jgi:hypothetical protein
MMPVVQPGSSSTLGGDALALRLVAFAKRVRGLRVRRAAWHAFAQAALVLACFAIPVAWLLPSLRMAAATVLVVGSLWMSLRSAWREQRVANAALLRGGGANLEALGDELATWLEWQPRAANLGMVDWLARTVDAELPALPGTSLQAVGRRPFGRARWLVVLVVLLLLAWWMWDRFPGLRGSPTPPPPPATTSSSRQGGSSQDQSSGGTSEQPAPQQPGPRKPPPPPPPPRQQSAPPKEPGTDPQPPPEPPAPLLDLPAQRNFVVPDHIDDGPTRRMRMHAAEVPEGPGSGSSAPGAAGAGEAPPPSPSARDTFERAAEAAQRARHVPAEEQPMVRRFFDLLQKAAR